MAGLQGGQLGVVSGGEADAGHIYEAAAVIRHGSHVLQQAEGIHTVCRAHQCLHAIHPPVNQAVRIQKSGMHLFRLFMPALLGVLLLQTYEPSHTGDDILTGDHDCRFCLYSFPQMESLFSQHYGLFDIVERRTVQLWCAEGTGSKALTMHTRSQHSSKQCTTQRGLGGERSTQGGRVQHLKVDVN